eukprot:Phypoly_transcript_20935.p1 GENE.Phypoly_transcript_20935~~Phypoly_transcript_20935.p1  ORF type:complete len:171 (-),score=38.35 Phypoly_transcript_20935:153-632(-)
MTPNVRTLGGIAIFVDAPLQRAIETQPNLDRPISDFVSQNEEFVVSYGWNSFVIELAFKATSLTELSIVALHKALKRKCVNFSESDLKKILPEELLEKFHKFSYDENWQRRTPAQPPPLPLPLPPPPLSHHLHPLLHYLPHPSSLLFSLPLPPLLLPLL